MLKSYWTIGMKNVISVDKGFFKKFSFYPIFIVFFKTAFIALLAKYMGVNLQGSKKINQCRIYGCWLSANFRNCHTQPEHTKKICLEPDFIISFCLLKTSKLLCKWWRICVETRSDLWLGGKETFRIYFISGYPSFFAAFVWWEKCTATHLLHRA